MLDYDFRKLNDKEFEAFCVDLLSNYFGKRIERFKPGKDSGVDGRFFTTRRKEVVIQCKHWVTSGVAALVGQLTKVEAEKLKILLPERYILCTSLPLSRKNKNSIQSSLSPWIYTPSDILGQEDLNSMLGNFKAVEERHYKLWFSSTVILSRLHNAAIKGRSEFKLKEAEDFAPKYVVTPAHGEAIKKLEDLQTIIVTGEPGSGKSTLAEQIAIQYALKGYELCCVADSINEAESIWEKDVRQLFYFDDFLGRNYLLALHRHEDSNIVGFIKRVKNDGTKRFILTSRTSVLNRGKTLSDLFDIENLKQNEYELKVGNLSLIHKSQILYNHLQDVTLTSLYVDRIYEDERYLKVSQHRNFNPRLISFITNSNRLRRIEPNQYWPYIQNTLDNPHEIWAHVFDGQLNDGARALVRLVSLHGTFISEEQLKEAYYRYSADTSIHGPDQFDLSVRLSVGSVLDRVLNSSNSAVVYNLFNPSLGDFITNRYKDNSTELFACFAALQSIYSIANLRALKSNSVVSDVNFLRIVSRLCIHLLASSKVDIAFKANLVSLAVEFLPSEEPAMQDAFLFINSLIRDTEFDDIIALQADLFIFAIEQNTIGNDSPLLMAKIETMLRYAASEEDYQSLSKLISSLSPSLKAPMTEQFIASYTEEWQQNIEDAIYEDGCLDDMHSDDDWSRARNAIERFFRRRLEDLFINIPDGDVDGVVESCDISSIIDANNNRTYSTQDAPTVTTSADIPIRQQLAAVRDLFDRS